MNAPQPRPKPGALVKVTIYGAWQHGPWMIDGEQRSWFLSADGIGYPLSDNVHVEVLPQPIYVNSDATEPSRGDVVRNGHGNLYTCGFRGGVDGGIELVWRDIAGAEWATDQLYQPLTLLVHNSWPVRA